MILADTFPACNSNLWNHINGWEVVVAVLLIMGFWAATNIARMHFMVEMSKATRHKLNVDDDQKGDC